MKYISGFQALQLMSEDTGTPGDWHPTGVNWKHPKTYESDNLPFGTWGIREQRIPGPLKTFPSAHHVRACLDLIALGKIACAQGMRENYLDNEHWTLVIFEKICLCRGQENWPLIDKFMGEEYGKDWTNYVETSAHTAR